MAKDSNGLEKRALYLITTEIDGQKLAWTHVVPEGTPRSKMGGMASATKVELRPIKEGDEMQLWILRPGGVHPEPSYQIVTRVDCYEDPNSPVMVYNINSDFSGDGDTKFHEEFNRLSVGPNSPCTEVYWLIVKQPNGKFSIQSFCGEKSNLSKDQGSRSAFNEVRVLEAFKAPDKNIKIRHMEPSQAASQQWDLIQSGYL